jgi:ubiquinone/menaquinone biosynthesis C-methylase UbiE
MQKIIKAYPHTWEKYWETYGETDIHLVLKTTYYKLFEKLVGWQLHALYQEKGPLKILELGCGTGSCTLAFTATHGDLVKSATFVDFSGKALNIVRETAVKYRLDSKIVTINTDLLQTPFSDRSFDLVWNEGVIEHFDGTLRQKAFDEMYRLTNDNGCIAVIVPNALNPFFILRKYILEKRNRWPFGFEKPFSNRELVRLCSTHPVNILQVSGDYIFVELVNVCLAVTGPLNRAYRGGLKIMTLLMRVLDIIFVPSLAKFFGRNIGIVLKKLPTHE